MATLDDKLLGEKMQNYCSSSSEDEDEKNDAKNADDDENNKTIKGPKFIPESEINEYEKWSGTAKNTGPKGVIQDWQRYKQLEREKSNDNEKERKALMKRLALTCKSSDLDDKELNKQKSTDKNDDDEIERELMDDEFFEKYLQQSIVNMQKALTAAPKFGHLIELTNNSYLNEIDNEKKNVTIIIHIYDGRNECKMMNECLESIANDYQFVKFCKIRSLEISLSDKFRKFGCPALLAYKNGELIGNFVCLGEEFGQDFYQSDVESFLIEHGLLPNESPYKTIKSKAKKSQSHDSDTSDD